MRGEIFELIDAWPRASMFAAPTMVKRLVEHDGDCRAENIRTIVWGGAPMYVEDAMRALDRFGPRFAQIYGQGESPMTITVLSRADIADRRHPRWRERLASAGRPFSCVEVAIANERGLAFPQGDAGRNPGARRDRDGGLLAERGGERGRAARTAFCIPAMSAPSMPTAICS